MTCFHPSHYTHRTLIGRSTVVLRPVVLRVHNFCNAHIRKQNHTESLQQNTHVPALRFAVRSYVASCGHALAEVLGDCNGIANSLQSLQRRKCYILSTLLLNEIPPGRCPLNTGTKQVQNYENYEWAARYNRPVYSRRKAERSPVQNFLFWLSMVILIGTLSTYLALLVV